ncbi:MAG TPA: sodium:calcium antiporter [Solirubrobacterales bacterium]|nr:sodium:calcium antiporter [Solirubrobacterales bacterium]
MSFFLLAVSFAVILAGALLFTNAVEWLGHRLQLGEGAVGSVLAAVGTAMPETLVAIVALIGAKQGADQVAIGAIVGAPFLLGTLAMGLVGLFAYLYRDRREQGLELDAHRPTLERDLLFFLVFFVLSLALAWGAPAALRIPVGILALLAYPIYIQRTLARGGEVQEHGTLDPLVFERRPERRMDPGLGVSALQLLVGLAAMVGGAHLFVDELLKIATDLGVEAVVLALILAPLATELPEKVNSFFWVRDGKDSLALGNITGAMVFQSTIPFGIGLLFTDWALSANAALSVALGLAGGFLAYEALHRRGRFGLPAVLAWFALYGTFIVVVVATA